MEEIILHAGFHKTGSSSIQHSLAPLDIGNTAYLDWGHVNHSMPFLAGFTSGELAVMQEGQRAPITAAAKSAIKALKDALAASKHDRVILSAEAFSVAGYRPGLERLREILAQFARRIRVVAYIRPLESLIASDFQQCARAGLRVGFGRGADYLQRVQMLDQIFGRQNVQFHVFSPETLIGGDVVQDFCSRLGIAIEPGQVRRVNESVSLETVAVARCAAVFGEVGVGKSVDLELNYYATNQFRDIGTGKFRIAQDVLGEIVRPFAAETRVVERRIGGLFPHPSPVEGGIRSDADLFAMAAPLEGAVRETVTNAMEGSPALDVFAKAMKRAERGARPEVRVALMVDALKRARRAERKDLQVA